MQELNDARRTWFAEGEFLVIDSGLDALTNGWLFLVFTLAQDDDDADSQLQMLSDTLHRIIRVKSNSSNP